MIKLSSKPFVLFLPTLLFSQGYFDAWDDYNSLRGVFDRNISTKIAGKNFKLTIASINRYNNGLETKDNIDVKFRLFDKNRSKYLGNSWIDFNASIGKDGPSRQYTFKIEKACKEVVVKFKACASQNDDSSFTLYPFNECKDEEKRFIEFESSDSFAIRPNSFIVENLNEKYIKAGKDFNITIKAINKANSSVKDYNAPITSLNIQPILYTPSEIDISCPANGSIEIVDKSQKFLNSELNATVKFSEAGLFKFRVSEKDVDEWASVDRDDTEDLDRYIQPSNNEQIFAFIPYKFETNATYETTNGKDWVYMHTPPKSSIPKMSVYIDYTVIAKNRDRNITQNFTNQCFSDENYEYRTTFDLYLNAEIDSSSDINISQYDEHNYTNYLLTIGENSIKSLIKSSQFTNGTGRAKIYFNIDRDKTKAVSPVSITLLEVNSSSTSPDYKEIDFIGEKDINNSKKFYYGRVYTPNYRITDTNQTKIFAEIYCKESCFCPTNYEKSVDNELWRINRDHSLTDGTVQLISTRSEVSVDSTIDRFQAGVTLPNITYDGSKGYPFWVRIKVIPDSWLIYNKYDKNAKYRSFFIEFYRSTNGWAGKGYNIGLHVDNKASKIPNKRINW